MIFRTKRGGRFQDKAQFDMPGQSAAPIQDGLPGGFSLPGQNAAQAVIRTAYRGDSACQDKPAQMIFQDKTRRRPLSGQGADDIQDGLSGGFSLPGQNAAQAQMIFRRRRSSICQDKARRLFRTAYRGDSACQDKPAQMIFQDKTRRRPLSGQGADDIQDGLSGGFSLPGQNAAQAQMIFRRRRSSICQDKARRLFRTAYWGIQLARTKRGAGGYQDGLLGDSAGQDKAQMIFRTKRGAGAYSGRLTGGIQLARTSRRR